MSLSLTSTIFLARASDKPAESRPLLEYRCEFSLSEVVAHQKCNSLRFLHQRLCVLTSSIYKNLRQVYTFFAHTPFLFELHYLNCAPLCLCIFFYSFLICFDEILKLRQPRLFTHQAIPASSHSSQSRDDGCNLPFKDSGRFTPSFLLPTFSQCDELSLVIHSASVNLSFPACGRPPLRVLQRIPHTTLWRSDNTCIGRVARRSNLVTSGRAEWQVRLRERGLVDERGSSRRSYHAEPESVGHDEFKDFDVIVPRRLGTHEKSKAENTGANQRMRDWTIENTSPGLSRPSRPLLQKSADTSELRSSTRASRRVQSKADVRPAGQTLARGKDAEWNSRGGHPSTVPLKQQADKEDATLEDRLRQRPNSLRSASSLQQSPAQDQTAYISASDKDSPPSFLSPDSSATGHHVPLASSSPADQQNDFTVSEQADQITASSKPAGDSLSLPIPDHTIGGRLDNGICINTGPLEMRKETQQMTNGETDLEDDFWPDINEKVTSDISTQTDNMLSPFEPLHLQKETSTDEIHILGTGVVGKFFAHSLAGMSMPPKITLLMQTPLSIQEWYDEGESITLYKQGRLHTHRGFHIESAAVQDRTHPRQWAAVFGDRYQTPVETPTTPINTLIVTTPAKITIPAILAVRERLRPTSTICLVHDGLGVMEDLNTIVFPNSDQRPTFILGSLTGSTNLAARTERRYMVEQKGDVSLTCSKQPQRAVSTTESGLTITRTDHSWKRTASFLVGCLVRTPEFHTVPVAHKSYMQKQLYSVLAHAVIGPISVLYDCTYLELLQSHHARVAMRGLIEELLNIVYAFPEMQSPRKDGKTLTPKHLEIMIRRVLGNKPNGVSTMLQNTRAGKRTDIDYYNGYLLLRAAELGVECPRNEMLVNVVKGKQSIVSKQRGKIIPLAEE